MTSAALQRDVLAGTVRSWSRPGTGIPAGLTSLAVLWAAALRRTSRALDRAEFTRTDAVGGFTLVPEEVRLRVQIR